MLTKTLFIIFIFFACIVQAQEKAPAWNPKTGGIIDGKTMVKINLLGLPTRNFALYGERIITKNLSFVVGANTMPAGKVPYVGLFTDDPYIKNLSVSSFSFTPEIRIFLSKSGYGKGFYLAPYYKNERYKVHNYRVEFLDENKIDQEVNLNGNLQTHSAGLAVGSQWLLGKNKNIVLDWTIFGVHYGINSSHFDGTSTYALSEEAQAEAKRVIEESFTNFKIGNLVPIKTENVRIDAHTASADISSPWAFIRTSVSIGWRF